MVQYNKYNFAELGVEANVSALGTNDIYDEALRVLQSPLYNPESLDFEAVIRILRNCGLLKKVLGSSLRLEEFIQLAKFHLNYEVSDSAQVLVRHKDSIDRLSFVLRGSVQKLQQKVFHEIEEEVKEEREIIESLRRVTDSK